MSDTSDDFSHLRRPRNPSAVNYLFVALIPLIFWMLRGDLGSLLAGMVLLGIFGVAGHMLVVALEDEEMLGETRGRLPRKLIGSGLIGTGAFLMALLQMYEFAMSAAIGLMAFVLGVVAFGVDRQRRLRSASRKGADRDLRKLLSTAERVLTAIPETVSVLNDEPSLLQARAFRETMLKMIEDYPDAVDDLSAELRHVLNEAAQATDIFVEDFQEEPEPRIRRRYMLLLKELAEAMELCLQEASIPDEPEVLSDEDQALFIQMDGRRAA